MSFKMRKSILTILSLMICFNVAHADSKRLCPQVSKINQQASRHLYSVKKGDDSYTMSSLVPFIDRGRFWILTTIVEAQSLKDARAVARETIKNAKFSYAKYAAEETIGFACVYGPGLVGVIGGWSV